MSATSERATLGSAVRAILVLPAIAAVALPISIASVDRWRGRWRPAGAALVAGGVVVVARTVVDFFTVGRGTLAPWDPPRRLVTVGLFAWCRNPMYMGVVATVVGWAVMLRSVLLAVYASLLAVVFHQRVVRFEEPWAADNFPDDWPSYRAEVPRWIPRRPRHGGPSSRGAR